MLRVNMAEKELWDSEKNLFLITKAGTAHLEHSLISMSKWESIWCVPFLPVKGKAEGISTHEQELSYIECMVIGRASPSLIDTLYRYHAKEIRDYIEHPATATTIHKINSRPGPKLVVTTELIYYWMVRFNIPFGECEKWHINRLLTLIDICNLKEKEGMGKDKMSASEAAKYQYEMNKARQAG